MASPARLADPEPAARRRSRAFLEALRAHGRSWKAYWCHTTFAFDHLSALAGEAIRKVRPDVVLQAGVLFGPDASRRARTTSTSTTRAPSPSATTPLPGLVPPVAFDPAWRAREQAVYAAPRASSR